MERLQLLLEGGPGLPQEQNRFISVIDVIRPSLFHLLPTRGIIPT